MTLGHQYRQSLPPPLSQGASTFIDLIPGFRKLASECFLAQMVSIVEMVSFVEIHIDEVSSLFTNISKAHFVPGSTCDL